MALFNYASKELTLKVVYYGPGLSGKTTNIQHLHRTIQPEKRGKLLSLATETDRTLFFDFLPVNLGKINDFNIRFQLYTVPGQIRYNSTRRLVLRGADAVVFVADSQQEMQQYNRESLDGMVENLTANGLDPDGIPLVLQYNKRDLKNIMSVEELDADLNLKGHPVFLAAAVNGEGVDDTFKGIIKILMKDLAEKQKLPAGTPPIAAKGEAKTAKANAPIEAGGPVYAMEDMIERFGPSQDMPVSAETEARAAAQLASPARNFPETKTSSGNGEAPSHAGKSDPPGADSVLPCLEDIQKALAGLASKIEALGPELKAAIEKAGQPAGKAASQTAGQPAAQAAAQAQPDPEIGKRIAEIKGLISGLPQAVSDLVSSKPAPKSETDKNKEAHEQAEAARQELLTLAREIKQLQEESLSYLKRICEPPTGKREKARFRLFGR